MIINKLFNYNNHEKYTSYRRSRVHRKSYCWTINQKKEKVIILDNLVTGYKKLINKKSKFIKADIKNKIKISKIIKDYNISSIIHLAAHLNVSEAEKNKKRYYKNNISGTKNLLKACKNSNVKKYNLFIIK